MHVYAAPEQKTKLDKVAQTPIQCRRHLTPKQSFFSILPDNHNFAAWTRNIRVNCHNQLSLVCCLALTNPDEEQSCSKVLLLSQIKQQSLMTVSYPVQKIQSTLIGKTSFKLETHQNMTCLELQQQRLEIYLYKYKRAAKQQKEL